MKCKIRKDCNHYKSNSFTCNKIRKPWYCGTYRYEKIIKTKYKRTIDKKDCFCILYVIYGALIMGIIPALPHMIPKFEILIIILIGILISQAILTYLLIKIN